VRSSALFLGAAAPTVIALCYAVTAAALAAAAMLRGIATAEFWCP